MFTAEPIKTDFPRSADERAFARYASEMMAKAQQAEIAKLESKKEQVKEPSNELPEEATQEPAREQTSELS